MELPNKCKEFFLDGITDVMFYPKEECVIPVPFNMAQVLYINNCSLPAEPVLRLATSGENYVIVENLKVKVTLAKRGNGTLYTYDISANVANGGENVREAYRNMRDKEYYVVLRKMDGSLQLCYTLPHTFGIGGTTDNSQTELARTFTATTQALSEPIPITLRE
ncbi:hypothetical protein, partial [uncultured Prevotella sp.]|uniref:hypothetical protein n=1 Tax=uncultured Prevotella sp. TaxID=159272 RepID=UPI0027E39878